jgi:hypothetical protein
MRSEAIAQNVAVMTDEHLDLAVAVAVAAA